MSDKKNYFHNKSVYCLQDRHKPLQRTVGNFESGDLLQGKKKKNIFRKGVRREYFWEKKERKCHEKQSKLISPWIFPTLKS